MTEFGRDNFSFNTKVNVGEFFENRSGGENVSVAYIMSGKERVKVCHSLIPVGTVGVRNPLDLGHS